MATPFPRLPPPAPTLAASGDYGPLLSVNAIALLQCLEIGTRARNQHSNVYSPLSRHLTLRSTPPSHQIQAFQPCLSLFLPSFLFTCLPLRHLCLPARSLLTQPSLELHPPSLPSPKTCTGKANTLHPRFWDLSCPRCPLVFLESFPLHSLVCAHTLAFRLPHSFRNQVPSRMVPGSSGTMSSWAWVVHWHGELMSPAGFSARMECKPEKLIYYE